jgi:hypothetical protein
MIEIIFCIAIANCGWVLYIADAPITCNGTPVDGCTYYHMKVIYLKEWNSCILWHEIQEHALKPHNNVIHYGVCN